VAAENGMPPAFAEQLALLRAEFVQRHVQTLAELDLRLTDRGADVSSALLQEAHDLLHRLSGSGGSFGFHALSRQARELEVVVRAWLQAAQPMDEPAWQAWKHGVRALAQTLGADAQRPAQ
jgi:HPt (histidine-containing phosphotransfer) domain-containing protein